VEWTENKAMNCASIFFRGHNIPRFSLNGQFSPCLSNVFAVGGFKELNTLILYNYTFTFTF